MNSKADWEKFAEANGLTWEVGPLKPRDQHGREYLTLIHNAIQLGEQVLKVLGGDKHVIMRMFPHDVKFNKGRLVGMRFSSYTSKPA